MLFCHFIYQQPQKCVLEPFLIYLFYCVFLTAGVRAATFYFKKVYDFG